MQGRKSVSVTFINSGLPGVVIAEPKVFSDERGFFAETYHLQKYAKGGIDTVFVQDNHSRSGQGVLRGMHYQLKNPQAKLVYVVSGEIFDVAVDLRQGSPSFGKWTGTALSDKNRRQMFIPEGFAHGFCVLSPSADVIYKCSNFYDPSDDRGLLWNDPDVAIKWPESNPVVSDKDRNLPALAKIAAHRLPVLNPKDAL
jgi:dTDP-4-dehydrorhamnose 3,5-epimerase